MDEQNIAPKIKKPFYKRVWFIVLCIVVILLVILTNIGNDSSTKPADDSQSPQTQAEGSASNEAIQKNAAAQFGDTIEVEKGLFLTVNSVQVSQGGVSAPDGIYLILDCTYENKTDKEANLSTLVNLYIKDDDGVKYDQAMWADTTGSLDGTLMPDEKQKGQIAFDVPVGTEKINFYYEPFLNTDGFKTSKWSLDVPN